MNYDRLQLMKRLLPAYKKMMETNQSTRALFSASRDLDEIMMSTIFDCRSLDVDFVEDTGRAAMEESFEDYSRSGGTEPRVALPDNQCYFEFSDNTMITAELIGEDDADSVMVHPYHINDDWEDLSPDDLASELGYSTEGDPPF
jgi:hypothetical protein